MPVTRSGLDPEHDNISGLRVREDGVPNKGICVEKAAHGREQNSNGQRTQRCDCGAAEKGPAATRRIGTDESEDRRPGTRRGGGATRPGAPWPPCWAWQTRTGRRCAPRGNAASAAGESTRAWGRSAMRCLGREKASLSNMARPRAGGVPARGDGIRARFPDGHAHGARPPSNESVDRDSRSQHQPGVAVRDGPRHWPQRMGCLCGRPRTWSPSPALRHSPMTPPPL
jgi:hypothetical protein